MSLRWQLILWYTLTVTAILIVFVGADVIGLRRNLLDTVDTRLRNLAEDCRVSHKLNRRQPLGTQAVDWPSLVAPHLEGSTAWVRLWTQTRQNPPLILHENHFGNASTSPSFEPPPLPPDPAPTLRLFTQTNKAGKPWRILAVSSGTKSESPLRIEAAVLIDDIMDTWQRAIWEHSLISLGLILLVGFVGYFYVRRALRPVRKMAQTARAITAEDLSLRIDSRGDKDEIGELASTLNGMIERLEMGILKARRFSGDVSHELKTPLTALKGELELALRQPRETEQYRDILTRISGDVDRLSQIVHNLLFLARIDEKNQISDLVDLSLDQLVLETFEETLPLANEQALTLNIEKLEECTIAGDGPLLARMLGNLLANSIKFSRPGGHVTLTLEKMEGYPVVTIVDNGIGIPADKLSNVFERFYRVDESRATATGGSGLGLAIVDEIAKLHRIAVDISSREGEGTTVTLSWPRA